MHDPTYTPIAYVGGVFNAVVVEGDRVDRAVFEGRGAGAGPTASAVAADLIDIARGLQAPTFAVPAVDLVDAEHAAIEHHLGPYYIRLQVVDRPGVMADIAAILRTNVFPSNPYCSMGARPTKPCRWC